MLFPIAVFFLHNATGLPEIAMAQTELNLRHVQSRNCLEILSDNEPSLEPMLTISPNPGACPVGSSDRLELPKFSDLPANSIRKPMETNQTLSRPEACLGVSNSGDLDSIPCDQENQELILFGTVNVASAPNDVRVLVRNLHSKKCIRLDEQGVSPFISDAPCNVEDEQQHFIFTYAFRYYEVNPMKK